MGMYRRFRWTTFDVAGSLPPTWRAEIGAVAAEADFREFPQTPVLSREGPEVPHISRGRVHAEQVKDRLPWLYQAYRGDFLELAREQRGRGRSRARRTIRRRAQRATGHRHAV